MSDLTDEPIDLWPVDPLPRFLPYLRAFGGPGLVDVWRVAPNTRHLYEERERQHRLRVSQQPKRRKKRRNRRKP